MITAYQLSWLRDMFDIEEPSAEGQCHKIDIALDPAEGSLYIKWWDFDDTDFRDLYATCSVVDGKDVVDSGPAVATDEGLLTRLGLNQTRPNARVQFVFTPAPAPVAGWPVANWGDGSAFKALLPKIEDAGVMLVKCAVEGCDHVANICLGHGLPQKKEPCPHPENMVATHALSSGSRSLSWCGACGARKLWNQATSIHPQTEGTWASPKAAAAAVDE